MGAGIAKVRVLFIIVFALAALSVILGAFGAHALEDKLTADQIATWKTANTYQFYHCLGAFGILLLHLYRPSPRFRWAVIAHLTGIVVFSGSLYLLSAGHLAGRSFHWVGPLTPIGGLAFITGWVLAITGLFEKPDHV